jgi:hypothetical protein
VLDIEQAANGVHPQCRAVDHLGEFPVALLRIAAHCVLQRGHRIGRPCMFLAAHPVGIFAAHFQRGGKHRIVGKRQAVTFGGFRCDFIEPDALDRGRSPGEIGVDEITRQPDASKICAPQ